jgi:hypothetical protein
VVDAAEESAVEAASEAAVEVAEAGDSSESSEA